MTFIRFMVCEVISFVLLH